MKKCLTALTLVSFAMMMFLNGCGSTSSQVDGDTQADAVADETQPTALRCTYEVGDVERIRLTDSKMYKTWVEMPDKDPTEPDYRQTSFELIFNSEVESVDADGTAIVKVTIEKAQMNLNSKVQKKENKNEYRSDKTGMKSTWPAEKKLHGVTYKIKVAPDTTVTEVIGLDEARAKLNLTDESKSVAGELIKEENIIKYHRRAFVAGSPAEVAVKSGTKTVLPEGYAINEQVPDVMIKAQAIKKQYTVGSIQDQDGRKVVKVTHEGEALHVLPEGIDKAPEPNNFGQTMIKTMSSMDKLEITGEGVFDLAAGKVIGDTKNIKCTLVILEDSLPMGNPENKKKAGTGGTMITTVDVVNTYEVIE